MVKVLMLVFYTTLSLVSLCSLAWAESVVSEHEAAQHLEAVKKDKRCLSEKEAIHFVDRKTAEASVLSSLFASKKTLSAVVDEMTKRVEKELDGFKAPSCLSACGASVDRAARFMVRPKKELTSYGDKQLCQRLEKETKASPIVIEKSGFVSASSFSSWFGDVAKGSGTEGKVLYEKCPGDCSPRYEITLDKALNGTYDARINAICGEARDKKDNKFELELSYLFQCR